MEKVKLLVHLSLDYQISKIANLRTDYEILETSKEYFLSMEDEEIKSELFLEANLLFPNFGKTKDST